MLTGVLPVGLTACGQDSPQNMRSGDSMIADAGSSSSVRPITSDGTGFAGHWTLLTRTAGDDDADSHTHELVEESGAWLLKDCQWQPPCEPEPWECTAPPPDVMVSGSVAGDTLSLEAEAARDSQVTRVRWDLTHVAAGTLRGTVQTDACTGDCDWPVLGCQIEAGLYPDCDENADFTGLLNCSCAPPRCD